MRSGPFALAAAGVPDSPSGNVEPVAMYTVRGASLAVVAFETAMAVP